MKVGLARGAFRSRAVCVAVETGLSASAVLLRLPSPRLARAAALSTRSLRLLAAFRLPAVVALKVAKSVAARYPSVVPLALPRLTTGEVVPVTVSGAVPLTVVTLPLPTWDQALPSNW